MEYIEMGKLDSLENRDMFFKRTAEMPLEQDHGITVPEGVTAEVYVEGVFKKLVKGGSKKRLSSLLGSDAVGKNFCVFFIRNQALPVLSWGIGNLDVSYEGFKDSQYRVGANGKLSVEISDYSAFALNFEADRYIYTTAMATEKISFSARGLVEKILYGLFTELGEPIVNTEFVIDEMNYRLSEQLCDKELSELPGVRILSVNAGSICVCDEDLQLLRKKPTQRKRPAKPKIKKVTEN